MGLTRGFHPETRASWSPSTKTDDNAPDATQLAAYASFYLENNPSLRRLPPLPPPGQSYDAERGMRAIEVLKGGVTCLSWERLRTAVMAHGQSGAHAKEAASVFLARELHAWLAREQIPYRGLQGLKGIVDRLAELGAEQLEAGDRQRTWERLVLAARRHALRLAKDVAPLLETRGWLPDPTRPWVDAEDGRLARVGASPMRGSDSCIGRTFGPVAMASLANATLVECSPQSGPTAFGSTSRRGTRATPTCRG